MTIEGCAEKLLEFCRNDAYPIYDLLGYRLADQPDLLQPELLKAVNGPMGARSSRAAWSQFIGRPLPELAAVPMDVDLIDSSDAEYHEARKSLEKCYRKLTAVTGIADVATTKMLYLKRPRLVAISDSYIRDVLNIRKKPYPSMASWREVYVEQGLAVADAIRKLGGGNTQALSELQQYLSSQSSPIRLSKARILDILLWVDMAIPSHWRWKLVAQAMRLPAIGYAIRGSTAQSQVPTQLPSASLRSARQESEEDVAETRFALSSGRAASLTPLTEEDDITGAFNKMTERLKEDTLSLTRTIGYQGGSDECHVRWNPDARIWSVLEPTWLPGRYWCAFGNYDPSAYSTLTIICEINPPKRGIDRRCAGVFLRDANGRTYLAHSGKVGGGRPGIGKEAFHRFFTGDNRTIIRWPDGIQAECIVIGALDDERFSERVAAFVNSVAKFKESATGG
jgi:hypothetical protein